jgi:hypothetical protein
MQIDLGIVEHPKMLAVAKENRWAWMEVLAYCRRNLTDGFLPEIIAARLNITRVELMDLTYAGLLDEVPGGWRMHDFLDYNPSREQIEAKRAELSEKRARSGRIGGMRSGESRRERSNEASAEASASEATKQRFEATKQSEAQSHSHSQSHSHRKTLAQRAVERSHFAEFWDAYPRKVGKRTAESAYARATTRASEEDILAGLRRLLPSWTDPQFIPHPTTWLNRDGWNDEAAQPSGPTASLYDLAEQARRLEEGTRFFG